MKLSQITFFTNAGGEQTLTLQDYQAPVELEFWGDHQRSVGGKQFSLLRGSRQRFRISYQASVEKNQYRTLFNNIVTDLANGQTDISISEGPDLSNAVVCIPVDGSIYRGEYSAQIGLFVPEMDFIAVGINTSLGGWVEEDWVEPGWVEMG